MEQVLLKPANQPLPTAIPNGRVQQINLAEAGMQRQVCDMVVQTIVTTRVFPRQERFSMAMLYTLQCMHTQQRRHVPVGVSRFLGLLLSR